MITEFDCRAGPRQRTDLWVEAGQLLFLASLSAISSPRRLPLKGVMGITGVFFTFGAALSPIVKGRIFDLTGSLWHPDLFVRREVHHPLARDSRLSAT